MIEKMKMVYIMSSLSHKEEMLEGLRKLGLLHIAERKSADQEITDYSRNLGLTMSALDDYAPKKKEAKKLESKPIIKGKKFDKLYQDVTTALSTKAKLFQQISAAKAEIERITPWGDFSPEELKELREVGCDLNLYRFTKKDFKNALENEDVKLIRLADVEKQNAAAVLGTLPEGVHGTQFELPSKSIAELNVEIDECNKEVEKCDEVLRNAALYKESFRKELLRVQNEEMYSAANETTNEQDEFVWFSGYIPAVDEQAFKKAATKNAWAWAMDDVSDDDENIPTKLRYNKVSKLIQPVFDILGILPGYRETDIALWFFLFFTLFFAMIIGDGGYGVLILIGTIAFTAKTKTKNTATYLLFVLSIATIIWGAITGTWFGLESAMNVPFLKAMVIPSFANYPELFGVTATAQQNTIMKFSFSVGAIQMALGSLIAVKKKISEKDLSWVADLGWMIAVIAMYLLSLYLVIGENIPIVPVFIGIGVAFLLVVLFGGMSPDKTFGQGLKSGLADSFTVFLNTISCFGNVMSYIRLFAVGMAGLAISQSFNNIAAGFSGPLMVIGIAVVLIGHALNIIMCFLSVVVHGVRLNVLEFSGQVGLEWTGQAYEPFKDNNSK